MKPSSLVADFVKSKMNAREFIESVDLSSLEEELELDEEGEAPASVISSDFNIPTIIHKPSKKPEFGTEDSDIDLDIDQEIEAKTFARAAKIPPKDESSKSFSTYELDLIQPMDDSFETLLRECGPDKNTGNSNDGLPGNLQGLF